MGIDIYMRWKGQTEEEKEAQFTGFVTNGETGYLRESYSGVAFATEVFVPESFDCDDGGGAPIPAVVLAGRMEAAAQKIAERYEGNPELIRKTIGCYMAFVDLAKRKEAETGEPVRVYASW